MSGLGETLQENARLRETVAQLTAQRDAAQAQRDAAQAQRDAAAAMHEKLAAEHALTVAKLDAVTARTRDLEELLARLERKGKGPANERFVAGQVDLFDGLAVPLPPVLVPLVAEPTVESTANPEKRSKPKRGTPKRRNLAEDTSLPHRKVSVKMPVEATCVGCGGPLKVLGTSVTHRVEWVPGHFEILDIEREKCACPDCPSEGVLAADLPCALPGAMCGNALLARVLVDKFADNIALNRQSDRMAREGFRVDTTTLSSWVLRAAAFLEIVAKAVRAEVLASDVIQADDTGLPVQDGTDGALRKGRLWAVTDREQVFFVFTATKHGVHPREFLADFLGHTLLVDGGSEFNEVVEALGLDRAGCWSHLRRYFREARYDHPKEAAVALEVARRLFLLEREHAASSAADRLEARQRDAKPLVDGLFAWAASLSTVARPTSDLGRAFTYLRNQEAELRLFLEDGAVPLHNNLSELMLRGPVVGRKNWLFAGNEGGAQAAATLFTLIASCRLQDVDPEEWLTDVLGKLSAWPANRVAELTPKRWREARHTG